MKRACAVALLFISFANAKLALAAEIRSSAEDSPSSWATNLETVNFVVRSARPSRHVTEIATRSEDLRSQLQQRWLGQESDWQPRCEVVLHETMNSYLAAVGRGGERTMGSALISFEQERVSVRRIDLRVDSPRRVCDALAHELTHVVLADQFNGRQIPRWADEGLAVLADSTEKQRRHHDELLQAARLHSLPRLINVFTLDKYPAGASQGIFYGQSASVVRLLASRGEPTQFVDFLTSALDHGYDAALRKTYNIDGVAELERIWRRQVALGQ